ncbi:hypothetical protein NKR19_g1737 [Coniochaeta hoffmannii]|uniref:Uncharacterized protein n=1 Tax=Coniochaeta hoffmannii TaxID=91930 RepID=A0AA38RZ85_9PEZI|nr:hypothetical protein NKR19_g1737 [Coniochaeta hoffmannii]
MKSKNKHLRPPPRKPWMLDNTSSSSLRNMEIGVPSGHEHPPPPPAAVVAYETKPLPPLPLRRSGISRFSTEVQNAFRTPITGNYCIPQVHRGVREASFAAKLGIDSNLSKKDSKVESGFTLTETLVQDNLSPMPKISVPKAPQNTEAGSAASLALQNTSLMPSANSHGPMPTGSVQKLLQITGAGSAASLALTNTSLTPSGHNSVHKIKQVMGIDVPLHPPQDTRRVTQEISPLTPESDSSSIYSQDRSDLGSDARLGREQASTPETSVTLSSHLGSPKFWRPASVAPSAVPASLHIVKSEDRGHDLATLNEQGSPTTNNYSHANGGFRQDLYHTTVSELAHCASSSSKHSINSSNSVRVKDSNYSYLGINMVQPPQRQLSFSNRSYQSKTRVAPPLTKLDTLNAPKYNAPVKTPYPLPVSKFDFDDDDATPTQRDFESDVSSRTTIRRPSMIDRIVRRASSPLTPTSHFTAELTLTATPRTHASALPSPLHIQAPPLLRHRKVKSQDTLRRNSHTVSSFSTNNTRKANRTTAPMFHNHTNPNGRTPTPPPKTNYLPTSRSASPLYKPTSTTTSPLRHSRSATPMSTPFVPRKTQHYSRQPPSVPPRGPTPQPFYPCPSKPSLTETAVSHLTAWAGRASERLEQARRAAGIRTQAERRRRRLKSNIKIVGSGKLEPPSSVVLPKRNGRQTQTREASAADRKDGGAGGRAGGAKGGGGGGKAGSSGKERVRVGMAFEKYSAGRAAEKVVGPQQRKGAGAAGAPAFVVPARALTKFTREKAAEKARREREGMGSGEEVKVWI